MTTRGKLILTLLILGVVGYGTYRWWDKTAPTGKTQNQSVNPADFAKSGSGSGPVPADIASKLLAGTNAVSLVDGSAIPPVAGVSDYDKPMRNGKLVVQFPINIW